MYHGGGRCGSYRGVRGRTRYRRGGRRKRYRGGARQKRGRPAPGGRRHADRYSGTERAFRYRWGGLRRGLAPRFVAFRHRRRVFGCPRARPGHLSSPQAHRSRHPRRTRNRHAPRLSAASVSRTTSLPPAACIAILPPSPTRISRAPTAPTLRTDWGKNRRVAATVQDGGGRGRVTVAAHGTARASAAAVTAAAPVGVTAAVTAAGTVTAAAIAVTAAAMAVTAAAMAVIDAALAAASNAIPAAAKHVHTPAIDAPGAAPAAVATAAAGTPRAGMAGIVVKGRPVRRCGGFSWRGLGGRTPRGPGHRSRWASALAPARPRLARAAML